MLGSVLPAPMPSADTPRLPRHRAPLPPPPTDVFGVNTMTWETPAATDYRFGFEITMYMYHR